MSINPKKDSCQTYQGRLIHILHKDQVRLFRCLNFFLFYFDILYSFFNIPNSNSQPISIEHSTMNQSKNHSNKFLFESFELINPKKDQKHNASLQNLRDLRDRNIFAKIN
ncbi:hypothetical protein BpHYR1_037162 [Brachionus plicatilis]|uniref:Uncharacterized protein n=1 Tax=Brachionus plicatilis TaxID=10195 RepID=A0A3M7RED7_BRAPC|nr:hypothetical protein BpHYR1_037162 [Brachionus plicatilis]